MLITGVLGACLCVSDIPKYFNPARKCWICHSDKQSSYFCKKASTNAVIETIIIDWCVFYASSVLQWYFNGSFNECKFSEHRLIVIPLVKELWNRIISNEFEIRGFQIKFQRLLRILKQWCRKVRECFKTMRIISLFWMQQRSNTRIEIMQIVINCWGWTIGVALRTQYLDTFFCHSMLKSIFRDNNNRN